MTNITEVSKSFDETLSKYGIDIIIGPADSLYSKYSAATGLSSNLSEARANCLRLPILCTPNWLHRVQGPTHRPECHGKKGGDSLHPDERLRSHIPATESANCISESRERGVRVLNLADIITTTTRGSLVDLDYGSFKSNHFPDMTIKAVSSDSRRFPCVFARSLTNEECTMTDSEVSRRTML